MKDGNQAAQRRFRVEMCIRDRDMDRSGMGFAFMEAFMDDLDVTSEPGRGTLVKMEKKLGTLSWSEDEE